MVFPFCALERDFVAPRTISGWVNMALLIQPSPADQRPVCQSFLRRLQYLKFNGSKFAVLSCSVLPPEDSGQCLGTSVAVMTGSAPGIK